MVDRLATDVAGVGAPRVRVPPAVDVAEATVALGVGRVGEGDVVGRHRRGVGQRHGALHVRGAHRRDVGLLRAVEAVAVLRRHDDGVGDRRGGVRLGDGVRRHPVPPLVVVGEIGGVEPGVLARPVVVEDDDVRLVVLREAAEPRFFVELRVEGTTGERGDPARGAGRVDLTHVEDLRELDRVGHLDDPVLALRVLLDVAEVPADRVVLVAVVRDRRTTRIGHGRTRIAGVVVDERQRREADRVDPVVDARDGVDTGAAGETGGAVVGDELDGVPVGPTADGVVTLRPCLVVAPHVEPGLRAAVAPVDVVTDGDVVALERRGDRDLDGVGEELAEQVGGLVDPLLDRRVAERDRVHVAGVVAVALVGLPVEDVGDPVVRERRRVLAPHRDRHHIGALGDVGQALPDDLGLTVGAGRGRDEVVLE